MGEARGGRDTMQGAVDSSLGCEMLACDGCSRGRNAQASSTRPSYGCCISPQDPPESTPDETHVAVQIKCTGIPVLG